MDRNVDIVINARTASTRIPNKLLRNFCDTNLISIALDRLLQLKEYNCYLAVADQPLIDLYEEKYADTHIKLLLRSPEAVTKGFNDYSIAWEHYTRVNASHVMCMNPCLPFTQPSTYKNAIKYFLKNDNIKTLTSVKSSENLFFCGNKIINAPSDGLVRTVENTKMYEMAHAFHIFDKEYFMNTGNFWDYTKNNPGLFEISQIESIDIDEPLDFIIAEKLYKSFGNKIDISNWK